MSSPLIAAAQALLTEATPGMVKQVLLLLLDTDTAPAPLRAASTPRAPRTGPRTPPTPRTHPKREAEATTAPPPRKHNARAPGNPDWEAMRQRIRDAMQERGTTPADLATAINRAEATVRLNLYRRKPPPPPMLAALRGWLDGSTVPAVTTEPRPFRRGRGRPPNAPNGSGSDTTTTAA